MARKNDRGKSGAGAGKRAAAARPAGRARVADNAKGAKPVAAKPGKPVKAPAPPPPPKVKFKGRLLENEPLSKYTTYRLGGPARLLVLPADVEDVIKALDMARDRGLPWLVLGLG